MRRSHAPKTKSVLALLGALFGALSGRAAQGGKPDCVHGELVQIAGVDGHPSATDHPIRDLIEQIQQVKATDFGGLEGATREILRLQEALDRRLASASDAALCREIDRMIEKENGSRGYLKGLSERRLPRNTADLIANFREPGREEGATYLWDAYPTIREVYRC